MGKTNRNSVEYSFDHTKARLFKRHKLNITMAEYDVICLRYKLKLVTIVGIEDGQHIFETEFKERMLKFVWCDKRERVTTVLK